MLATDVQLMKVGDERDRQEGLVGKKFNWTAASPLVADDAKLRILVEEVGEVARAIHDGIGLYDEVTQVAAIAVAWMESLDG